MGLVGPATRRRRHQSRGRQFQVADIKSYSVIGDDLPFGGDAAVDRPVADQWELGAALGGRASPIQIWFMKFDRLGLGYRTSSNGDLRGITFVFRSKFDE